MLTLAGGVAGGADASPSCVSTISSVSGGASALSCDKLSQGRLGSGGAISGKGALATVVGGLSGGAIGAEFEATELDDVTTLSASPRPPAASTPPSPCVRILQTVNHAASTNLARCASAPDCSSTRGKGNKLTVTDGVATVPGTSDAAKEGGERGGPGPATDSCEATYAGGACAAGSAACGGCG